MTNAVFQVPLPDNELVLSYAPGSKEKELLLAELDRQLNKKVNIPLIIGGTPVDTGNTGTCVCPHNHGHVLANYQIAGENEINRAIKAALEAKKDWENLHWSQRASIFLKAADLISTKYRYILNAATMLNQSKSPFQAEIDSTCELADFLRFNAYYMQMIYEEQPVHNPPGIWNRLEYRPMEGFIFAVSPFNFTAIAGNLPAAPAIMGNTVLWKPASTAVLSSYYLMQLFKEAGLPPGVINFIPAPGRVIGDLIIKNKNFAGVHFTGSSGVFNHMWKTIGDNISNYKEYPRIVGETGGKDFIFAHQSANVKHLAVALVRGAFEYQGQKCSAASRAYIPVSLWPELKDLLGNLIENIKKNTGDPKDFKFFNAVIDESSFDNTMNYINNAKNSPDATVLFGGNGDKSTGYFIEPTIIQAYKPDYVTMQEEIFAPVLTIFVYPDEQYEQRLEECDQTSPYSLTGAIFAQDRYAIKLADEKLKHAAGNFYINDKPTGAVVGQQPFGGSRASGTNDKAGFYTNLLRWCSPRTIKENFTPPEDYTYPFMNE